MGLISNQVGGENLREPHGEWGSPIYKNMSTVYVQPEQQVASLVRMDGRSQEARFLVFQNMTLSVKGTSPTRLFDFQFYIINRTNLS